MKLCHKGSLWLGKEIEVDIGLIEGKYWVKFEDFVFEKYLLNLCSSSYLYFINIIGHDNLKNFYKF